MMDNIIDQNLRQMAEGIALVIRLSAPNYAGMSGDKALLDIAEKLTETSDEFFTDDNAEPQP